MFSRDLSLNINSAPFRIRRTSWRNNTATLCVRSLHFRQRVPAQFMREDQVERNIYPISIYQILPFESRVCRYCRACRYTTLARPCAGDRSR
jgi:hypothetical protein